jgi:hypothetical protein
LPFFHVPFFLMAASIAVVHVTCGQYLVSKGI